ncbi:hypothetical protein DYB32_005769 [Aphanomyces invadans]|uniref:Uncharacterized protein n=1 Tax=Aphanomyces invadans TaxID=157072 RepID=A0A418ATK0_9STRA|nr:hypothetical protein DYB32_005769 [Aphanomyces invadans]
MPSHLPPPTLLDLLCRKEVIFNGPMSTEPILSRVLVYLGMQVTDVTLERIGSDLMYLDNLHLSGCPLVTDAGIAKLLPSSRFDCIKVTFRRVAASTDELVLHFASRPKAVGLWCDAKPNKFMPRLTSHDGTHHYGGQYVCTSLKVLNVIGCPKVSRAAPAKLKSHHTQIKVLQ